MPAAHAPSKSPFLLVSQPRLGRLEQLHAEPLNSGAARGRKNVNLARVGFELSLVESVADLSTIIRSSLMILLPRPRKLLRVLCSALELTILSLRYFPMRCRAHSDKASAQDS